MPPSSQEGKGVGVMRKPTRGCPDEKYRVCRRCGRQYCARPSNPLRSGGTAYGPPVCVVCIRDELDRLAGALTLARALGPRLDTQRPTSDTQAAYQGIG